MASFHLKNDPKVEYNFWDTSSRETWDSYTKDEKASWPDWLRDQFFEFVCILDGLKKAARSKDYSETSQEQFLQVLDALQQEGGVRMYIDRPFTMGGPFAHQNDNEQLLIDIGLLVHRTARVVADRVVVYHSLSRRIMEYAASLDQHRPTSRLGSTSGSARVRLESRKQQWDIRKTALFQFFCVDNPKVEISQKIPKSLNQEDSRNMVCGFHGMTVEDTVRELMALGVSHETALEAIDQGGMKGADPIDQFLKPEHASFRWASLLEILHSQGRLPSYLHPWDCNGKWNTDITD